MGVFVAQSIGLRPKSQWKAKAELWELGLVTGKKRNQMLCLRASGNLELVAGTTPFLWLSLCEVEKRAIPLIAKPSGNWWTRRRRATAVHARQCEARKLETQTLHEGWQKEYRAQKKRRPEMSDVWYAQQIAKLDIGKGRSAETIRRHMTR